MSKYRMLDSAKPDTRNGSPVTLAICDTCGTVRAFTNMVSGLHPFPDTGFWMGCQACGEFRMFFRVADGKVISEKQGDFAHCSQPSAEAKERLIRFLIENYGVVIGTTAGGRFGCMYCGREHAFAADIDHAYNCVFKPFERRPTK